jgi:hypothetical protein
MDGFIQLIKIFGIVHGTGDLEQDVTDFFAFAWSLPVVVALNRIAFEIGQQSRAALTTENSLSGIIEMANGTLHRLSSHSLFKMERRKRGKATQNLYSA